MTSVTTHPDATAQSAFITALADGNWHPADELIQTAMTALMASTTTLTEGQRITASATTAATVGQPDPDQSVLAGAKAIARTTLTEAARSGVIERDPNSRHYRINPAAAKTWGATRIK